MQKRDFSILPLVLVAFIASSAIADPIREKIIDGTPVSENSFPYVAKLLQDGELLCTGTLIGSRFILTAAHCFFDERNGRAVGDTDLTVRLGGQEYNSAKVYIHPAYVSRSSACVEGETDAAVMELASEVGGISPIPLLETAAPVGSSVVLVGYGTQGNGSSGENGTIPATGIVNYGSTVVEGYGSNPPEQNSSSSYFYWTFDSGESNTASGDSGGPAFFQVGEQLYLAGITCGGDGNAQIGTFSFDTRTDLMATWIYSITGGTPANTAPGFSLVKSQTASLGKAFSYRIPVTGSSPLQLTASNVPDGFSFDGSTLSGTPTVKGTFTVSLTASNEFGSAATDLTIVVSGFEPTLTMRRVLLQFDYADSIDDFLDITGKIGVGPKFNPRGKTVTVQIGRFSKSFRLDSYGESTGGGKSYFDLAGPQSGATFRRPTLSYSLTLERVAIFDELSTLGFPASADASEGQQIALPLTVTINGISASATVILSFRASDARWRIASQ